ncbi:MAG TPA: TIGR03557 family F420-dependent LLM class oxidoreductase [Candidatus Acidoferrales bacterium]|nr:TIGR03557 family F420-dependent LLM class oxidoreductase [Candidatus Acidoferrales bacterium]
MAQIGYTLSSEEFSAADLVRFARRAEESGFSFALISDHYHPWTKRQGHSPFVWSVLGGVAQATTRLRVGTGVTCPLVRTHPSIIAQAAATTATMLPGRFFLGLGTGENLNEHILGTHWPPLPVRQQMLIEAVEVLRTLWREGSHSYRGDYYTVENARIFDIPERPPPVMIAAAGAQSAEIAGRIGDGLISTMPEADLVRKFQASGGEDKPCFGQLTVCWAKSEPQARRIAHERWPVPAIPGKLKTELATPEEFELVAELVTEEALASKIVCGPDPEKYVEKIAEYVAAGFDHVYLHQVGPDQEGFFRFYESELLPRMH